MSTTVSLKNGACEAVVSSLGAELMEWRVAGRELLWNGDPQWWPRRSPTLFPFCGWLRNGNVRAKGRDYPTNTHGFGRETDFTLTKTGDATATMTLSDTPETRAQFPFAFRLSVDVALSGDGVTFDFAVENPDNEILPYSLGFHPGFVWPFDGGNRDDYMVEFDAEDRPFVPKIYPGGLFSKEEIPIPLKGRRMNPAAGVSLQDSLCMMDTKSTSAAFIAPSGRRITVSSRNFPHWVLWTKPGGPYLCIERWTGQGDPVDFAGDVLEKPGMKLMPPGGCDRYSFTMRFA